MSAPSDRTLLGLRKLPPGAAVFVMPLMLSLLMTCMVSLISTLRGIGLSPRFIDVWLSAWMLSWLIAFPTLVLVLPWVRRMTAAVVRMP